MSRPSTRQRLLDTAEELFAVNGIDAVSLRQLTSEAGANLAAVHYHFGSKRDLVLAVFKRRIEPINARRLECLDALQAGDAAPELDEVLRAFLEPALSYGATGPRTFFQLVGRAHAEPDEALKIDLMSNFGEVARRFLDAVCAAVPDVPRDELCWRMHFLVGSMVHLLINEVALVVISDGRCDPNDPAGALDRLVAYAAAGLRAPVPESVR